MLIVMGGLLLRFLCQMITAAISITSPDVYPLNDKPSPVPVPASSQGGRSQDSGGDVELGDTGSAGMSGPTGKGSTLPVSPAVPKLASLSNRLLRPTAKLPDEHGYGKVLDAGILVILLLGMAFRIKYCLLSADMHNYLLSLNGEFDNNIEDIIVMFEAVAAHGTSIKVISIVAIFMGLLQFFRYISVDPRLNIVTATIYHSAKDLLPVFAIFIVVLVSYGVLGTEIYGDTIGDWSNLSKSLATLFIIVLGEFSPYFESEYDLLPICAT
jgi:hypothetical protein